MDVSQPRVHVHLDAALSFLHGLQPVAVIHTNLTPHNVVIGPSGQAKVRRGLLKLVWILCMAQ
jgi:hypothetical protein